MREPNCLVATCGPSQTAPSPAQIFEKRGTVDEIFIKLDCKPALQQIENAHRKGMPEGLSTEGLGERRSPRGDCVL